MELFELTIHELHEKLKKREVTSVEATRSCLSRIEATDPGINAFITVAADDAMRAAEEADRKRASGDCGILTGIPLALKDIFVTRGIRTTCASKILANYVPPYDATSWFKLKDRGAVLLGKLNQDEFAMGSSCENSAFGPTKNPWNPDCIPGGSSGGSAAAVAAQQAIATLGTQDGRGLAWNGSASLLSSDCHR